MLVSISGINLIKRFEGLRLDAYKCPAGVWTIGYGHTNNIGKPNVEQGMSINKSQANLILLRDIMKSEDEVEKILSKYDSDISQGLFDVCVSFQFNLGALHEATWIKLFFNKDIGTEAVVDWLLKWSMVKDGNGKKVRSNGLVRRRNAEGEILRIARHDYLKRNRSSLFIRLVKGILGFLRRK
jgi:lysozyme